MEHLLAVKFSYLIPLLPLAGALLAGFLCTGTRKKLAHWPIWLGVLGSAVLSVALLCGMTGAEESHGRLAYVQTWYQWITAGNFTAPVGFLFDPLTAVMLCVVTVVSFLITIFAAGYMKGEEGYSRFFAYIGLFVFMMTILVMGDNLLMLYLGWEGVGLCSYLLIGYYYERPAAREAAKKAFLVNRIGDYGFGLGILLTFLVFGTVSFFSSGFDGGFLALAADASFISGLPAWKQEAVKWIPFLLLVGAVGKSAQFPLYVWLPDAMEGPTPVSALIHAATMVTAGVYMIARCGALFVGNEAVMWTITAIGAFTAIFAATIAMRQFDLKKVFAYSTISQLGYMFVAVGVLAPVAGVFHLITHAFFKALLFLASGVVMHAMAGQLDMRKLSGLKAVMPATRWLMLIGCAALAGVPFTSGFFSKDEIIVAAWRQSHFVGILLLLTALITAYYTFRLYFRVFEGPLVQAEEISGHGQHADDSHAAHHNHEPRLMIWPLVLLAAGALFAGYLNSMFTGEYLGEFLGKSPSISLAYNVARVLPVTVDPAQFGQHVELPKQVEEATHTLHVQMMVISGVVSLLGIALAYYLHLQSRTLADELARRYRSLVTVLDRKYWVDEVYQAGIVESLRSAGRVMYGFDGKVIDGLVWMVSFVPQGSGFVLKLSTQRGQLQGYALTMLVGIVILLVLVFAA